MFLKLKEKVGMRWETSVRLTNAVDLGTYALEDAKHLERECLLVSSDLVHRSHHASAPRRGRHTLTKPFAQGCQVRQRSVHSSHVLVDERTNFELGGWFVRDKVFPKRGQVL
jgi:hypothetical protein